MIITLPPLLPDPLPPGYHLKKTQRGTVLEADLDLLGRIYDAFALVGDGRLTLAQIAEMLFETGLRTEDGKSYTTAALRAILHEPFYAGYVRQEGKLVNVDRQPLIPKDWWRAVQRQIGPCSAPDSMHR